jgi:hypothetical protein
MNDFEKQADLAATYTSGNKFPGEDQEQSDILVEFGTPPANALEQWTKGRATAPKNCECGHKNGDHWSWVGKCDLCHCYKFSEAVAEEVQSGDGVQK